MKGCHYSLKSRRVFAFATSSTNLFYRQTACVKLTLGNSFWLPERIYGCGYQLRAKAPKPQPGALDLTR
eukprot:2750144-Amphidinium_carterae.1